MSAIWQSGVPLAPLTTWKIGGAAEWLARVESREELLDAREEALRRGLRVWILGRGSNVLIPDEGLPGLTICLRDWKGGIHWDRARAGECDGGAEVTILEVPAGLSLPRLAKEAGKAGYGGYSFYIGIPGTVGGAVVMNAGFGPGDERQTAGRCVSVETVGSDGKVGWHRYADLRPRYRRTDLQNSDAVVLRARFRMGERADGESIRKETAEHLAMRKRTQPLTRPTAGSVFKGTADGQPAGRLIEEAGLKGLRVGGAVVSEKHANWMENLGDATAADVLELIRRVQEAVERRHGIFLEPEVRLLSVNDYR